MNALIDGLERLPVATITHVLLVAFLGLYLLIHGSLPHDALVFGGIAEGGNIGVACSRAHVKAAKAKARPTVYPAWASGSAGTAVQFKPVPPPPDDFADDEPGDPDSLAHISSADPASVPADQGDVGR